MVRTPISIQLLLVSALMIRDYLQQMMMSRSLISRLCKSNSLQQGRRFPVTSPQLQYQISHRITKYWITSMSKLCSRSLWNFQLQQAAQEKKKKNLHINLILYLIILNVELMIRMSARLRRLQTRPQRRNRSEQQLMCSDDCSNLDNVTEE
jgi:hypothetical protein